MNDLDAMFGRLGVQALAGFAIGCGLLLLYRWIRRESPLLGAIVATGLLVRAALGLALFWTSYLDLPFLRSLHTSDGFWVLAPDAREYATSATRAALDGLESIEFGSASPAYVQLLALWMRVVGISPISGMFLNLVMYALLCALVVYAWKPSGDRWSDLPCVVLLASLSFSPGLIIHGTQSLKDDMFTFLVSVGSIGALLTMRVLFEGWRSVRPVWLPVIGFVALLAAVHYVAGIRAYFSFFMFASLTAVLVLFTLLWNTDRLRRRVPLTVVVLLLTGVSYTAGAGPYDVYLRPLFRFGARESDANPRTSSESRWRVLRYLYAARVGFEKTGGATNIAALDEEAVPPRTESARPVGEAVPPRTEPARPVGEAAAPRTEPARPVGQAPAPRDVEPTRTPPAAAAEVAPAATTPAGSTPVLSLDGLEDTAVGLAAFFVPVSLLGSLSIVDFPGGRGLLFVTDIDTLFIDVTILAGLVLLCLRWTAARRDLPYVCFLLLLGCTTTALMAYVVTNFGTLFRLRMMAVVPLWMLALSTSGGRFRPETSIPNGVHAARVSQPAHAGRRG